MAHPCTDASACSCPTNGSEMKARCGWSAGYRPLDGPIATRESLRTVLSMSAFRRPERSARAKTAVVRRQRSKSIHSSRKTLRAKTDSVSWAKNDRSVVASMAELGSQHPDVAQTLVLAVQVAQALQSVTPPAVRIGNELRRDRALDNHTADQRR